MVASVQRLIYVVGGTNLQNRLLASFLEEETGAKCLTVNFPAEPKATANTTTNSQKLTLCDCLGKNRKDVFQDFHLIPDSRPFSNLLGLFNMRTDLGIEEEALALGARGFFYEQDPLEQIARGVLAMFNGELWVSRKVISRIVERANTHEFVPADTETSLTARETEILAMIAGGATNGEIGERLFISGHTVKSHLYNVFKKIGVSSRLQAALWAAKNLRVKRLTL